MITTKTTLFLSGVRRPLSVVGLLSVFRRQSSVVCLPSSVVSLLSVVSPQSPVFSGPSSVVWRLASVFCVLLSASAWAGDLSVDNLTVVSNAAIYGKVDIISVASDGTTNGATATGGTITTNGNYRIHTFTNSDTFTVSGGLLNCDVLVVAGGGGGASSGDAGGGGAGGMTNKTGHVFAIGDHPVVVGVGGAGNNAGGGVPYALSGGNSSVDTISATGGGGGACYDQGTGLNGGSGGGGARVAGGSGIPGEGFAGGVGAYYNGYSGGGGGGGASEVGGNSTSAQAGKGGDGRINSYSGVATVYAGGGGGGAGGGSILGGAGGSGGGGAGTTNAAPENGVNGLGGGGGGNWYGYAGGNGGSGIVIVRYPITTSSNITSLSISSNGISQISPSGANVFMGKVGIGTTNPAEKLHVAGNLRVDGTSIVSAVVLGGVPITNWSSIAAGVLMASNNLSDVDDKPAARANLGLGSAATNDAGVFLATNGNGAQLTNITAAQVGALSTNAGALIAANNLSELSATAATARSNLGLGSAATNNAEAFLSPDGNGSQLTGITAAQVGALGTNGGIISGELTILSPGGNIPMGVYTNQ